MMASSFPQQKKRHHYIPITYLARFADEQGHIVAYRKDNPTNPLHLSPENIAFERYYYSQPLPEGGQDNNRLEDLFSTIEAEWPDVVAALERRIETEAHHHALFVFLSLLRVRTPAARDPYERILAHSVHRTAKSLQKQGRLPPPPPGFEDLLDHVQVAIDPHMSIHAMPVMVKAMARLFEHVGFEVVHNQTREDFLTSDNPVIYFDPDQPETSMRPFTVDPGAGRIELLFPLTPKILLRGRSELPLLRPAMKLPHVWVTSRSEVRRVNRMAARFGYRFVFAGRKGLEAFVSRYAALSPGVAIEDFEAGGAKLMLTRMVFAPRAPKPKWRREAPESRPHRGGDSGAG